ncbi:MAG TPA: type II toxin-antitoxin system RelE/ParE family toxin [Thermomicrobiales bacterium]|nr:type II toxin-antitoxin system RelE/ParE family toxin [Thermomicrobiales bacterium]
MSGERELCIAFRYTIRAQAKLDLLENAASLDDLRAIRGNRLEALKGDRLGQYSIRINDQYRICFEWPEEAKRPFNIEIVDYH